MLDAGSHGVVRVGGGRSSWSFRIEFGVLGLWIGILMGGVLCVD